MTYFRKMACLSLLGLASFFPTAAYAQEGIVVEGGRPIIRVSYAGLDLGQPAGVKMLMKHVNWAAKSLCYNNSSVEPLFIQMYERQCYSSAMTDASNQVDMAIMRYKQDRLASRGTITVAAR